MKWCITFTSLSRRWAALCTLGSESAESLHKASKIWLKNMIKSPLTTYKNSKNEVQTARPKRTCVVQVPLSFSPSLCYTKLHMHNNELCCLGAKKSARLVGQFAGHQIRRRGKLHKGKKEGNSTILNATSRNNNNSPRDNISNLFRATIYKTTCSLNK